PTTEIYTLSLHDALPILASFGESMNWNARKRPIAPNSRPGAKAKETRFNFFQPLMRIRSKLSVSGLKRYLCSPISLVAGREGNPRLISRRASQVHLSRPYTRHARFPRHPPDLPRSFRQARPRHRAQRSHGGEGRSDVDVHQRRHEPVQGHLPGQP